MNDKQVKETVSLIRKLNVKKANHGLTDQDKEHLNDVLVEVGEAFPFQMIDSHKVGYVELDTRKGDWLKDHIHRLLGL